MILRLVFTLFVVELSQLLVDLLNALDAAFSGHIYHFDVVFWVTSSRAFTKLCQHCFHFLLLNFFFVFRKSNEYLHGNLLQSVSSTLITNVAPTQSHLDVLSLEVAEVILKAYKNLVKYVFLAACFSALIYERTERENARGRWLQLELVVLGAGILCLGRQINDTVLSNDLIYDLAIYICLLEVRTNRKFSWVGHAVSAYLEVNRHSIKQLKLLH